MCVEVCVCEFNAGWLKGGKAKGLQHSGGVFSLLAHFALQRTAKQVQQGKLILPSYNRLCLISFLSAPLSENTVLHKM